VPPQLIPLGVLVTFPDPVPCFCSVRVDKLTGGSNVAVTARSLLMSTEHVPAPEQAPPQATKVEPPCGVAVRFTIVPAVKVALQVVEQAVIPGGSLSTMPSLTW
jgi:hypothetical protein